MVKFSYTQPTPEQLELMTKFREKFQTLYDEMNSISISNRGMSIANTKFEESAMWLNKAITENC